MSRIDDLINELCPDGVEYKNLGSLASVNTGSQLNKTALSKAGEYPVINGGISPSGYYHLSNTEEDTIAISQGGASAGYVNFIHTKFWAGAHCFVIKPITECIENKYLYYILKNDQDKFMNAKLGAGIPGLNRKELTNYLIPIPPLAIQQEIVNILDKFTTLEAELEAELEARKKQYEYYLNQLLTPVEVDGKYYLNTKDVLNKKLGDLVAISTGKLNANAMDEEGLYPFFTCAEKPYRINTYAFDTEAILVSGNGSQVGHINHYRGKFNAYQRTYVLHKFSSSIIVQYLLFYLKGHLKSYILSNVKEGSVPYITLPMLLSFQIPIPPLEEQERIVSILEKFDALVSDISVGLPAEIEARRKQYEYYRNKLLRFKNIADAQGGHR